MQAIRRTKSLLAWALCALGLSIANQANAAVICAYDPAGKSGDYYALLSDFAIESASWGTEVEIKAYTDEETAAKDYEAGHCDGVVATGVRLQRFNRFPTTIEAIGALPDYGVLQQIITTLTKYPNSLTSGDNDTVGFIPVGAVYLFLRDRNVNTVQALAGKRIATMDYDKPSLTMVDRVGAIVVPADLGSIGPKFNNGDVDACYVSAPAYRPFELHRGLGEKGGVLKIPLAQATLQVLLRKSSFPEGYGDKSRTWFAGKFDHALGLVKKAEADIPSKYWIEVDSAATLGFDELFQATRIKLRDELKAYDGSMLKVMRQLRCSNDGARPECAEQKE
jgi:hypothetical protein